jgi:mRNA-degrading endonuclease toxin of MazEF toxin-antitoxin module
MKSKIVLVPFPFDDLSSQKVRPALCLTDEIQPYGHVVVAFITSQISAAPSLTDLVIEASDADFANTGLKVSSTIRLHRLMTVTNSIIRRQLGELSAKHQAEINDLLRNLFDL